MDRTKNQSKDRWQVLFSHRPTLPPPWSIKQSPKDIQKNINSNTSPIWLTHSRWVSWLDRHSKESQENRPTSGLDRKSINHIISEWIKIKHIRATKGTHRLIVCLFAFAQRNCLSWAFEGSLDSSLGWIGPWKDGKENIAWNSINVTNLNA